MTEIYGKINSEKLAEESKIAHEIVREINNFQISDRQRWLIMYYLGLEAENVDEMKQIVEFIKELKGSDIFISKIYGSED